MHARNVVLAIGIALLLPFLTVIRTVEADDTGTLPTIVLTDGKDAVNPGNAVVYVIKISQSDTASRTLTVDLVLPSYVSTVSAENGGIVKGNTVRWSDITLIQNQTRTLSVMVNLVPSIPAGTVLTAKASAAGSETTDTTLIGGNTQTDDHVFHVAISDGKATAQPGGALTYMVSVKNTSTISRTADVQLSLPRYFEAQDIQPATSYDSSTLLWKNSVFSVGEEKKFIVQGVVQRNAPDYLSLDAKITVGAATASDRTAVKRVAASSHSSSSSRSSSRSTARNAVLLSKRADVSETVPGSIIRYTIRVQNILVQTINGAVVTDRFDAQALTVVDSGSADVATAGQLRWKLPALKPGDVWEKEYSLSVASELKNGEVVRNIASISGDGITTMSMNERVTVAGTDIVTELPETGAANDVVWQLAILPCIAFLALLQRKAMQ